MQAVTTPHRIDDTALRQIFLDARTHNKWQPKDVPDELAEGGCRRNEDGADEC